MDIEKIKYFFEKDREIKEILFESKITPNEENIEYQNRLFKTLKLIELIINRMCESFSLNDTKKLITEKFQKYQESLAENNINLLNEYYQKFLCKLDEKTLTNVRNTCIGYTRLNENKLITLIKDSTSINEILHILHSYVVNNNDIIDKIPIIKSRKYLNGYPISIRGIITTEALDIFNELKEDSENAWTDIISLPDKIIMMIRDKGHALTIEIETENEKYYVKYFVPKILDTINLNELPGLRKMESKAIGEFLTAIGEFSTTKEQLAKNIANLIENIPDDCTINANSIENIPDEFTMNDETKQDRKSQ